MKLSITRIMQFANCRHRYFLSEILGLRPIVTAPALHIGTLVHCGKDAYYESLKEKRSHEETSIEIGKTIAKASEEYEAKTAALIAEDRREATIQTAREQAQLAAALIQHYVDEFYEKDLLRFAGLVAVEMDLSAHAGRRLVHGHADAVWMDADEHLVVSEWKTTGDKEPATEWLNLSWQNVIYSQGVKEVHGKYPVVEYCLLRKKVPLQPKVNKNGSLSKAACDTTLRIFKHALAEAGNGEAGYEEILAKLAHNRFNWQIQVHRNEAEATEALAEIGRVIGQIGGAKRVGESAFYRNTEACRVFSCPYRSICMERTPEVVEANYTTPEKRAASEADEDIGF